MDWGAQIDGYCERLGPGYWAEPVNALTNAAFLIAALVMARRLRGQALPLAWSMCALLFAIGVGSYLWHTHATGWSGLADVLPILGFSLLYIYSANRDFWQMPRWAALLGTCAFLPYAAATGALLQALGLPGGAAGYAPLPIMIAGYAIALSRCAPTTARGLALGTALLCLSLTFRTLDEPLCRAVPLGTHFLWHLMNAAMLGWMIEVYRRHMLAERPLQG